LQKLKILPMNSDNFDEAKSIMEETFTASVSDLPDNFGVAHDDGDIPSIDGVLEKPEATPLVFYQGGEDDWGCSCNYK
jgi:hypothetical protein